MSYILDALRKADAQRESDPARGIHAQPVRMANGEARSADGSRIGFWAAGAAGVAALASVVGWYVYRDAGAVAVAPPVRTEVAVAAPAPASVDAPAAPPPAAAVMPPPVVTPTPVVVAPPKTPTAPVAQAPVVQALPVEAPAAATPQRPERVGRAARRARLAAAAEQSAGAQPSPPAAAAPAVAVHAPAVAAVAATPVAGLPADAPKLAISGGVYSSNAAQRMLIVNGQVFNEGVEVGPGVTLEEIKPKGAVLKFRGSRYTVSY